MILGWAAVCGVLGAVALPLLNLGMHRLLCPGLLRDGQYFLVVLVTAAQGLILGGLSGSVLHTLLAFGRTTAGWVAAGAGTALLAVFLLLGWFVFAGTENPGWADRDGATLFWFGPALLWANALLVVGDRLLRRG